MLLDSQSLKMQDSQKTKQVEVVTLYHTSDMCSSSRWDFPKGWSKGIGWGDLSVLKQDQFKGGVGGMGAVIWRQREGQSHSSLSPALLS